MDLARVENAFEKAQEMNPKVTEAAWQASQYAGIPFPGGEWQRLHEAALSGDPQRFVDAAVLLYEDGLCEAVHGPHGWVGPWPPAARSRRP